MSRHIAPCPYCDDDRPGHEVRYIGDRSVASRVRCMECGVTGPWADGLDAAVEAWNELPRKEAADE